MSRRRFLFILVLLLAGGLLAPPAGAGEVTLADTWLDENATQVELRKILVVAITTDPKIRHRFEDRFVSMLRGRNSDGVTKV